ncbi:MAG: trypsin-like serine protease [Myxococcales bacterium]|nr:trypsin-like serine protease [Myxococcales bacterium]
MTLRRACCLGRLVWPLVFACSAEPSSAVEETGSLSSDGRNETGYLAAGYLIQRPGVTTSNNLCDKHSSSPTCLQKDGASNAPHCSAVLVSPFFALTAAHCLDLDGTNPLDTGYVRYDSTLVEDGPPLGIGLGALAQRHIFPVHYVIVHPDYVPSTEHSPALNDIALLKFQAPQGSASATSSSPTNEALTLGCGYRLVGYGYHDSATQWLIGERRSYAACFLTTGQRAVFAARYASNLPVAPENFVFQGSDGNACLADSGSPVFIEGTRIIVGILSALISAPDPAGNMPVCPAIDSSLLSITPIDTHRHFISSVLQSCSHKALVRSCLNAVGIMRQLNQTPTPPWRSPPFPHAQW